MMTMTDVTQILNAIQQGDPRASEELLPLVYEELRVLARQRLANEKPGQTLQATALVHEAYLRLVGNKNEQSWDNRGHFFAAAAEAMRRIVVDSARRKKSLKRGGHHDRQELAEIGLEISDDLEAIISINEALETLEKKNKRAAMLVKLRYFAGFSIPEAAEMLGVSPGRGHQIWAYAKSWLLAELGEDFQ
jgi:RNA polymerase sigma factor (TIGR02999 family)